MPKYETLSEMDDEPNRFHKNLTMGTALAPIVWIDRQKDIHNFGQAGFVIRVDYKKICFGYNILYVKLKKMFQIN